jgi:DNA-binding FadR family transcriptional regulator
MTIIRLELLKRTVFRSAFRTRCLRKAPVQVSRVVIREAIRALELTGFVTLQQALSGGAYVMDLSLEHLSNAFMALFQANKLSARELIQLRLHVESEVTRLAAMNSNDESSERLEKAFQAEHNKPEIEGITDGINLFYFFSPHRSKRSCSIPK